MAAAGELRRSLSFDLSALPKTNDSLKSARGREDLCRFMIALTPRSRNEYGEVLENTTPRSRRALIAHHAECLEDEEAITVPSEEPVDEGPIKWVCRLTGPDQTMVPIPPSAKYVKISENTRFERANLPDGLLGLDLSENTCLQIPDEVWMMTKIRILILNQCRLSQAPPLISGLASSLKELDLSRNNLKELSSEVFKLKKLQILDISHNPLKTVPKSITNLKDLQTLRMHGLSLKISNQAFEFLKRISTDGGEVSIMKPPPMKKSGSFLSFFSSNG